jgi:carbohydrate diacid regulator
VHFGAYPNLQWRCGMISNLVLQDTINGIKNISRCDLTIVNLDGKVIASTEPDVTVNRSDIVSFAESQADFQEIRENRYFKVYDDYQPEYVIVARGDDNTAMVGKLAAFQIQNLLVAYKEHFDKDNFIKNLLLDNLLLVDVYNRAKRLHIATEARRVVYILESEQSKDYSTLEAVKNLFAQSKNDFITAVDEKSIIIIKELEESDGADEMHHIADRVVEALDQGEHGAIHIAYGNPVNEIKEVSHSYKEARMALDVGKIFFEDQNVVAYSQLGIGRLIYQLPIPLCKMFIKEIFTDKSPDDFDDETITTINKFFENNLNVSETSRQLYIHRNTLVYRLDKLQKSTGLDLRVFDDAITFKIALMVVKYMKYMETLEY